MTIKRGNPVKRVGVQMEKPPKRRFCIWERLFEMGGRSGIHARMSDGVDDGTGI